MPEIVCGHAGCRRTSSERFCEKHRDRSKPLKDLNVDTKRSTTNNQDVYSKPRWKNLRNAKIILNPYCEHCERLGIDTFADEVDHIIEIEDDPLKAFDIDNLQSLCREHHQAKTNKERARRIKELSTHELLRDIIRRSK